METTVLINKITEIIQKNIPANCPIKVYEYGFMGTKNLAIIFGAKEVKIDAVENIAQCVSLSLSLDDLELTPQVFGGAGGQSIRRKPDLNDAKEKYLYCKNIRVPFRTPQKNETAVLKAIERFAQNYTKLMRENKAVLLYQDKTDNYSNF